MLNESYLLSQALDEAGMSLPAQDPSIKVPGISTGPAIRVCLDTNGGIVRCEPIVKDNWPGLWGHFDGNHNSFPVIRLAQPLMVLPESEQKSGEDEVRGRNKTNVSATERRKALIQACAEARPRELADKDSTLSLLIRLRDKAAMLSRTFKRKDKSILQVCHAYNRLVPRKAKTTKVVPLLDALREWAIQRLPECDEPDLDALEVLLFTASGESGKKKVQLALDIDDPVATIYRSEVRKTVTEEFLRKRGANKALALGEAEMSPSSVCAFAGGTDLWTQPFPKVRLPALGREFCIFSMFSAAECNLRYGLRDSQIIPVSKDIVLRMQDSLNGIMAPERKGKTWRSIAGEKPGNYDQLIAYVDGQPDIPAPVADLFGTSGDTQERQFDADVSAVCDALEGIRRVKPGSRLNLFVLRKASEGQAFVALVETPTVEEVLAGAEWWQTAAKNVPVGMPSDRYVISLPVFSKDKEKPEPVNPSAPYPGQVVVLLTEAWLEKHGGANDEQSKERTNKLRGAAFTEVLDVMLQRPGRAGTAAEHILSLLLDHCGLLLRGLAECQARRTDKDWRGHGDRERLAALRAVSTIGMTLYALGSKKEDYMHEAAFQVGQVLALADRLHRCYCTVVRDGSIPPNLIGNAHFSTALDNPERALAALAERFRIYQGWAETVGLEPGDGDKAIAIRWAKKILGQYKGLALRLHQQGLPVRCDDLMKAHMFLGYLAEEERKGEDK